ncbi:ig(immunoglobulin) and lrr(leucine rich repeat) domain [Holotrichia oblita]|uniref:Ig(Immunoglobulin) and lrr(Leucine rich repeat) domain n=1 Tax=Holotrichia oblita TaxID=644536 RepID=A0ACB9T965_HOLOL|nr:ig(immunoglobulin) and lrr(leucine rich repeat) domain [Holotrichia oblita]
MTVLKQMQKEKLEYLMEGSKITENNEHKFEHTIFIIQCYYKTGQTLENGKWVYSINRCIEEFRQQFPNLPVTYAQLLKHIQACVIKFGEIGAVTRKPGGGAPKKRTANLIEDVQHYWKKPLTLSELLEEMEADDDAAVPDTITIFPPENVNEDSETDEDSWDENLVDIYNLPGCQLRAEVQAVSKCIPSVSEIVWESVDDIPLSTFVERKLKLVKSCDYKKIDLVESNCPDWEPLTSVSNDIPPGWIKFSISLSYLLSRKTLEEILLKMNFFALLMLYCLVLTYLFCVKNVLLKLGRR